ncbi:uncharacterized protein [Oscarella lobularis]|uniref:uncharacterized protein n=1 Tax=Oscarella lobularis TaxID=121494 RepID=UPI003313FCD4
MKPPLVGFRRKRRHNAETREEREVLRCTNIGIKTERRKLFMLSSYTKRRGYKPMAGNNFTGFFDESFMEIEPFLLYTPFFNAPVLPFRSSVTESRCDPSSAFGRNAATK